MRRHTHALTIILLVAAAIPGLAAARAAHTCDGLAATIVGTPGNDTIVGTSGSDVIVGLGGADHIDGGDGHDVICGGNGADTLEGGRGRDLIFGGQGRDRIDGGGGRDRLAGGAGADELVDVLRNDTLLEQSQVDKGKDALVYESLELRPTRGVGTFDDHLYSGDLVARTGPGGIVVIERVAPEMYLLGVDEVPFSWDPAALEAQAIAARTYLANLVAFGPWGLQATYGFDICDTTNCQVYRGIGVLNKLQADRWQDAVEATEGLILLYENGPAATLYHSTAGSSTRSIQDVWPGSFPAPYLQAVPVEGETSPFTSWSYDLPLDAFLDVLAEHDITFEGKVRRIRTKTTDDGDGPYQVRFFTSKGRVDVSVNDIQSVMNGHGAELYPDLLPATYGSGFRYPLPILSPTFTVRTKSGDVRIAGEGWGHQIGMSQWGAQAMALDGDDAAAILGHFYGGLTPVLDPGHLPNLIDVGLGWARSTVEIGASATYRLSSPAGLVARGNRDTFTLVPYGDEIRLVP